MSRRMLMAVLSVVLITPALRAQDKPAESKPAESGSERDRGRDRGGDRGGTPEERSARMTNFVKERLGEMSDDEWKVIQPKLQKVADIRRDQMSSMFGGFGRSRDGNNEEQPKAGIAGAAADLRKALENKSATPEEISKKLTALREAKAKAKTELEAAQKELKEVLTQRQEATLVTLNMLD